MIEKNAYMGKARTLDGKVVYARFSSAYVEMETRHVFADVPEGRSASEFAHTLSGKVRNDQTGAVYETAHDVEDAPYTYTEVFPNPRQLSEYSLVSGYYRMNTNPYPDYSAGTTYKKGDRVIYNGSGNPRVYESDFDENKGNTPTVYGWTMLIPYIPDHPAPDYVTIEEFNAIIDEMAAEQAEAEAEAEAGGENG